MIAKNYWARAFARGAFTDGGSFCSPVLAGSDESQEKAREAAEAAAGELAAKLCMRKRRDKKRHRGAKVPAEYSVKGLVEPILERPPTDGPQSEPAWVITRNHYGCPVLCAEGLLIADMDFASAPITPREPGWLKKGWEEFLILLGAGAAILSRREAQALRDQEMAESLAHLDAARHPAERRCLERLSGIAQQRPELRFEIYRTCVGLRVFETSREWAARSEEAWALMSSMGCDLAYMALCRQQDCFRARLQPKPWRVGLTRPVARYPFETESQANEMAAWLALYESKRGMRRACAYMGTLGSGARQERFERALARHDQMSEAGIPLGEKVLG